MVEYLNDSCCGVENVYDISVESDVEPAYWNNPLPDQPLVRARLMSGTNPRGSVEGTIDQSKELSQSTGDIKLSSTTFHNIKVKTRSFLDLEIWKDDDRDGSDDYDTGAEEILGIDNTTKYPDDAKLSYFYDSLTGKYRYIRL